MTEIEKLIEKACANYCEKVDSVYNEKDVFKAGASFILHQNRWRKVEEELPETNVDVLLKFDNGNVSIGVYCKDEFEEDLSCINGDEYSIYEVTEWKPIE